MNPRQQKAPTATTVGASQDTTRADQRGEHLQTTILGTVGASAIHSTQATVAPLARGRPPDAEPPDVAASGGSPDTAPSSTSSGLGDASILHPNSAAVYPRREQPTKREREREAYLATARVKRIGPGHYEAESGSRPGEWYTCLLVRGHLSCSCPATGPCKHLVLATPLLLADARLLERENREAAAPSLLGPERLAAARLAAGYDEGEPVWGGAS